MNGNRVVEQELDVHRNWIRDGQLIKKRRISRVNAKKLLYFFVAVVFSCKTCWDSCPRGHSREHKPLHYAKLTCRTTNFGMVRGDEWVLSAVRS